MAFEWKSSATDEGFPRIGPRARPDPARRSGIAVYFAVLMPFVEARDRLFRNRMARNLATAVQGAQHCNPGESPVPGFAPSISVRSGRGISTEAGTGTAWGSGPALGQRCGNG